jgi:hypothetical protein
MSFPGTSSAGKDGVGFVLEGVGRSDIVVVFSGCVALTLSDCWRVDAQLAPMAVSTSVTANTPTATRQAFKTFSFCGAGSVLSGSS